jgi:polysaccharide transporter, PST family
MTEITREPGEATPPEEPLGVEKPEERLDLRGRGLRQHAARGTVINTAFRIGLAGLGLLQRLVIAAFLTQEEFGIWGIVLTTLLTLAWLKEVGVADKFIQQSEPDQEEAFQKAFTIEFMLSLALFAILLIALPVYALAYGRSDIIVPGAVLALAVPIGAFATPVWIAYRRMQFVRQRVLTSIDPVMTAVVTVALGIAGLGYWALVIGALSGTTAAALAAVATSPYKPRLRFSREAVREYAGFSWPLFGYQLTNILVVQGVVLVAARAAGVEAVGIIAFATSITVFAERVDNIVSDTIYPAVCAVAERRDLVYEAFMKSNRLAVMWGMPFGVGVGLFAGDLVEFVLGSKWDSGVGVLAAVGVLAGFRQVAFNWQIFMRAANRTRPMFWSGLINIATFAAIVVPCIIAFDLTGYVVGTGLALAIQIIARGYFLRQLFSEFRLTPVVLRAVAPVVPSAGAVLLLRTAIDGGRSAPRALAEVALYVVITGVSTWLLERSLISEMLGYLRGQGGLRTRGGAEVPAVP